jgi:NAD(P)-dependent dehydrogenase (short-subunit alcohol dehydrogenase family)
MKLNLYGKKAFISGSTEGIGFAIAQSFLKEGVEVVINGRSQEKIDVAIAKLSSGVTDVRVSGIRADFTVETDVDDLLAQLSEIDILVNNVGLFDVKSFFDVDAKEWQRYFDVNVMSGVKLSKHLLPSMIERDWGRVISTKSAQIAFSNGLAKLTKDTKVTVNTILGGPIYSDGVARAIEQIASLQGLDVEEMKAGVIASKQTSLINRFIEPTEIASFATFLASPVSSSINGAALRADGGVLTTIV